jgi:hypothetical protein
MQILMSIESALEAQFKQPDGPSLPGVSWLVRIDHGGQVHHVRVQALLAAEIVSGWNPAQEREHTIHMGNLHGQPAQPWWGFW